MDSLTQLIKNEMEAQYKSVYQFSKASGIPYMTISNALAKGIGTTAYDTVVKICTMLGIRQSYDEDIVLFNREFHDFYSKLTELDERGIHTVTAILNVEYARCRAETNDGVVKGYNGIGFAPHPVFDEERINELVRKVKEHE